MRMKEKTHNNEFVLTVAVIVTVAVRLQPPLFTVVKYLFTVVKYLFVVVKSLFVVKKSLFEKVY
jgi:hypothetical protein